MLLVTYNAKKALSCQSFMRLTGSRIPKELFKDLISKSSSHKSKQKRAKMEDNQISQSLKSGSILLVEKILSLRL